MACNCFKIVCVGIVSIQMCLIEVLSALYPEIFINTKVRHNSVNNSWNTLYCSVLIIGRLLKLVIFTYKSNYMIIIFCNLNNILNNIFLLKNKLFYYYKHYHFSQITIILAICKNFHYITNKFIYYSNITTISILE